MDILFDPFIPILRKLCLFKPPQSQEPLAGHCCFRALSRMAPHSNCHISLLTPLIEVFLSILESSHYELRTSYGLTLMSPNPVGGRRSQRPWPSPTLGSLGSSHHWHHKSQVPLRAPPCAHGVSGIPYKEVRDNLFEWGS